MKIYTQEPISVKINGIEIEDIISRTPPFIVRFGTFIFLVLLILVTTIFWFIQYPDLVQIPAELASINSPIQVKSVTNGRLLLLNVKENEQVHKGKVIGVLGSKANHDEILQLSAIIDSLVHKLNNSSSRMEISFLYDITFSKLGELNKPYLNFTSAYLKNYLPSRFYIKKKKMLLKDVDNLDKKIKNLVKQKILAEEDLFLFIKNFEFKGNLLNNKIFSNLDYRNKQTEIIVKKQNLFEIEANIINSERQIIDKEKEIEELNNIFYQQKYLFQQSLNTFKSKIDNWKKKYLLIAPINGKVSFSNIIEENQEFSVGQTICSIIPENMEYYAKLFIPQNDFRKVEVGQIVLLKFISYPIQEYGVVKGQIVFISDIRSDSGYFGKIRLINTLKNNNKKQIHYKDGLIANAQITTKNLPLLQRFYNDIVYQIKR